MSEANTARRVMLGIASKLGLSNSDWDCQNACTVHVEELEAKAANKVLRERREAALLLQRRWASFSIHQTTKRLLAKRRAAATRFQRWWRAGRWKRLFFWRRVQKRKEENDAATRLQAAAKGWLVRFDQKCKVAMLEVLQDMGSLQENLRMRPVTAATIIQARLRGWLARVRYRRLLLEREEAAKAEEAAKQAQVSTRTRRRKSSYGLPAGWALAGLHQSMRRTSGGANSPSGSSVIESPRGVASPLGGGLTPSGRNSFEPGPPQPARRPQRQGSEMAAGTGSERLGKSRAGGADGTGSQNLGNLSPKQRLDARKWTSDYS